MGIAYLPGRYYNYTMTKTEQTLVSACADSVFRGSMVRQENPTCECGKIFTAKELLDAPGVFFREVDVFGKKFTLIEPMCPVCKQRIEAHYHILN
jgi:hypothetical protein